MRSWWISIALLGACGGSSKQAAEPVPEGPSCKRAAEHMVDELAANLDPRPPDEKINGLIQLIRTRCEQDAWSVEAQRCLTEMKSAEDANRCGQLLTEAQQTALVRDQSEAMGVADDAAKEGGAPPPPPPPPPGAAPAPTPASAPATRGPMPKGAGRTEDPDQGGE